VNKKPPGRNFKKGPVKARRPPAARPRGPAPASRESDAGAPGRWRQAPPDNTLREAEYIKGLVANKTHVRIRLRDNETVEGVVEYYDTSLIRLTRAGEANLFIYKKEIKYLEERA
jgi:sRNA-binding regulator protein Hfq